MNRVGLALALSVVMGCGDDDRASNDGGGATPDQPCEAGNPGLRIVIEIACCDAHNASLLIQYPGLSQRFQYPVDTERVVSGGTVTFTTSYPSGIETGDAEVLFYADGGGTWFFDEAATIPIDAAACSRGLVVSKRRGGPPDAGM